MLSRLRHALGASVLQGREQPRLVLPAHAWIDAEVAVEAIHRAESAVAAGAWKWQFQIGDRVIAGTTEARLYLLAVRRVHMRIDRELKKAAAE